MVHGSAAAVTPRCQSIPVRPDGNRTVATWKVADSGTTGSNKALQEILEFAHLRLDGKGRIGNVADIHRQEPVIMVARQLRDDAAVLHLALADTHLELVGPAACVAQVDVADEG